MYTENNFLNIPISKLVESDRTKNILLLACKIKYINELEVANEVFNFVTTSTKDSIDFKAYNENLLKSCRLGYIKNELSRINYFHKNIKADKYTGVNDIIKLSKDSISVKEVNTNGFSRLRMGIPELLLQKLCEIDELLWEEQLMLDLSKKDLLFDPAFLSKPVYKTLTGMDYIKL